MEGYYNTMNSCYGGYNNNNNMGMFGNNMNMPNSSNNAPYMNNTYGNDMGMRAPGLMDYGYGVNGVPGMGSLPNMMTKPIQTMYPKAYYYVIEPINNMLDNMMRMNMQQVIPMAQVESMTKEITDNILRDDFDIMSILEADPDFDMVKDTDRNYNMGSRGFLNSLVRIMLINELLRRGCRFCY